MKLASQHLDELHELYTAPLASANTALPLLLQAPARTQNDWLELALVMLIGFASLLAFSLLLPDGLGQLVQQILGWSMAGAMLGLALLAAIKGLSGLLES